MTERAQRGYSMRPPAHNFAAALLSAGCLERRSIMGVHELFRKRLDASEVSGCGFAVAGADSRTPASVTSDRLRVRNRLLMSRRNISDYHRLVAGRSGRTVAPINARYAAAQPDALQLADARLMAMLRRRNNGGQVRSDEAARVASGSCRRQQRRGNARLDTANAGMT